MTYQQWLELYQKWAQEHPENPICPLPFDAWLPIVFAGAQYAELKNGR
jgi:hypothetical protein